MRKRIFSLFLALTMCVSLLPIPVMAQEAVYYCQQEAHTHEAACHSLSCGQDEAAPHTHTEPDCYTEGQLSCQKTQAHDHGNDCFDRETKLCDFAAVHTHADACRQGNLSCGKTEHTHDEGCAQPRADCGCPMSDGQVVHEKDCELFTCLCPEEDGVVNHQVWCPAYVELTCSCTESCAEGQMNSGCVICKAEDAAVTVCGKYVAPTCSCTESCTEGSMNPNCEVCKAQGAAVTVCGKYVPTCSCTESCTEGSMNPNCEVCKAEGAAVTVCGKYVAPTCTCTYHCSFPDQEGECVLCRTGVDGCVGKSYSFDEVLALLQAFPGVDTVDETIQKAAYDKLVAALEHAGRAYGTLSAEDLTRLGTEYSDLMNNMGLLQEKLTGITPATAETGVARIGSSYYASLNAAVNAASAGSVIYLTADDTAAQTVTISKSLTIDLDGNDLPSTVFGITGGTVILRDSKGNGVINANHVKGKLPSEDTSFTYKTRVYSSICITGSANVSLNNITVHYATGDLNKAIYLGGSGASLVINGGSYYGHTSSGGNAIYFYNDNGSSLTINDGYLSGCESFSVNSKPSLNTLHLVKVHLVNTNAPFYIQGGGGLIRTEAGMEQFIDTSISSFVYANPSSSTKYYDVYIVSNKLAMSPGFTAPENGSASASDPAELILPEGGSVVLQPQIIGGDSGSRNYVWSKDGSVITGATGSTYTATESGSYSVTVSDASGATIGLYWTVRGENDHVHDFSTSKTCSCGLHSHDNGATTFDPLTSAGGTLSPGRYYLTDGLTASGTITVSGVVDLCLCGKTLDLGSDNFQVNSGGSLTVYGNCTEGTNQITSTRTVLSSSGTVTAYGVTLNCTGSSARPAYNSGVLTLSACNLTGSYGVSNSGTLTVKENTTVTATARHGIENTGTLYLESGTVKSTGSSKTEYSRESSGSSGILNKGTLEISGGSVIGSADYGIFSTSYSSYSPVVTISAGSVSGPTTGLYAVTDNTISISGNPTFTGTGSYGVSTKSSITISGAPKLNGGKAGLCLDGSSVTAAIGSTPYTGANMTIRVSTASEGRLVMENVAQTDTTLFALTNEGYELALDGNTLVIAKSHVHDFSSGIYQQNSNKTHAQKCTGCDEYDTAAACTPSLADSTCMQASVCTVCEQTLTAVKPDNHSLVYAADPDNAAAVLETCANGCTHQGRAAFTVPSGRVYAPGVSNPASVSASNWKGAAPTLVYQRQAFDSSASYQTVTDTIEPGRYRASMSAGTVTTDALEYQVARAEQSFQYGIGALGTAQTTIAFTDSAKVIWDGLLETPAVSFRIASGKPTDVVSIDASGNITPLKTGSTEFLLSYTHTEHYAEGTVTLAITVENGTLTITDGADTTGVYNGTAYALTREATAVPEATRKYSTVTTSDTQPGDATFTADAAPTFTEAGTHYVWVRFSLENYADAYRMLTIVITEKPLALSDFTFDLTDREYTGSPIEPSVRASGLVEGTDYTVSYTDNTAAGTATITVTGMGNYSGTLTQSFTIDPQPLVLPDATELTITQAQPGEVTVSWPEDSNASGYTIQLYKNNAIYSEPITITGKDTTSYTFSSLMDGAYSFTLGVIGQGNYEATATTVGSSAMEVYTIRWINWNDSLLQTQYVLEGITPAYTGATPTKTVDDGCIYTFANAWDKTVAAVTADATYKAQFTAQFLTPTTPGAGSTIDYKDETITIPEGYEANTSEDFTGTAIPSGSSISGYLGQTIYIRKAATTDPAVAASAAVAMTLEGRPAAPAEKDGYTIDYAKEQATATGNYEISTNGTDWSAGPLDIEPGETLHVRLKATDGEPSGTPTANALADAPQKPTGLVIAHETITAKGDGSISGITDEMEYRINDGTWVTGPASLTDLPAGTKVEIRTKAVTTGSSPAFAGLIETVTIQGSTTKLQVTFSSAQATAPAAQALDYNTKATNPGSLTATGYTFGGWYEDSACTTAFDFDAPIRTDTVIYAKWTINQYTITFVTGGGTAIPAITLDYKTSIPVPSDPIWIGYIFDGWDKAIPAIMPAENLTITAKWVSKLYQTTATSPNDTVVVRGKDFPIPTDGAGADLAAVLVDGVPVDPSNYTLTGDPVQVTLAASYTQTLSAGPHTIRILFQDGWIDMPVDARTPHTESPKTTTYSSYSYVDRITVPVSGDEKTVQVSATISGTTAELAEIRQADLKRIIGRSEDVSVVTVDVSKAGKKLNGAVLPTKTIQQFVKEATAANNKAAALEIVFSHGSVLLDEPTMEAILAQSQGKSVRLVLDDVGMRRLNQAQRKAVADMDVLDGFEAYLVCTETSRRISDFQGGNATLSIPFQIPSGRNAENYHVWYVSDQGDTTRLDTHFEEGRLYWKVGHFSDFIVTYEEPEAAPAPVPEAVPAAAEQEAPAGPADAPAVVDYGSAMDQPQQARSFPWIFLVIIGVCLIGIGVLTLLYLRTKDDE